MNITGNKPLPNILQDMEVTCHIRLGTIELTIAELQQLTIGKTMQLQQSLQEPLDILVNQHVIARGELMSHDDFFAIQITEVFKG